MNSVALFVGCANWQVGVPAMRVFRRAGFGAHVFCTPTDALAHTRLAQRRVLVDFPLDRFVARLREFAIARGQDYALIVLCDEVIIHQLLALRQEDWVRPFFPLDHARVDPRICVSKIHAARFLDACGLPQPRWRALRGEPDLEAAAGDLGFPLFLKPEARFGGEGVRRVDSLPEFLRFWREERVPQDYIAQQFLAGPVGSIAALYYRGNPLTAFFSRKALCFPPVVGQSCVREFVDLPALHRFVSVFGRESGYSGLMGFDLIVTDSANEPFIIEINLRPTPQVGLDRFAGVDFAARLRAAHHDGDLSFSPPFQFGPDGARRLRMFPTDLIRAIHEDSYLQLLAAPLQRDYWRTALFYDPCILNRQLRSLLRPALNRLRADVLMC